MSTPPRLIRPNATYLVTRRGERRRRVAKLPWARVLGVLVTVDAVEPSSALTAIARPNAS